MPTDPVPESECREARVCLKCGRTEEGWRYNRCPNCGEMAEQRLATDEYTVTRRWLLKIRSCLTYNCDPGANMPVAIGMIDHALDGCGPSDQLERNGEWQPISTAPKDGTPILIWAPEWKFANCGWWQSSINGTNDAGWTDGTVISWNYQENSVLLPTVWQPLPKPPEAK